MKTMRSSKFLEWAYHKRQQACLSECSVLRLQVEFREGNHAPCDKGRVWRRWLSIQLSTLQIYSCLPAAEPKSLFHVLDIHLQQILAGPLPLLPWKFWWSIAGCSCKLLALVPEELASFCAFQSTLTSEISSLFYHDSYRSHVFLRISVVHMHL